MNLLPRRVLPVLMYHRFGTAESGDPELWVTMEQFAAQLRWLKGHGFRTLSLDEAYASLTAGRIPDRAVLLTIDDGFAGDLERAADLLDQEGARAAVFVPAGLLGQTVNLSHPAAGDPKTSLGTITDSQGLRRWLDRGFDVGCHAMTHLDLTTCDAETLHLEISQSREHLAASLGQPIRDFCYPFAHHNDIARRAVEAAGYRAAYAGEPPSADIFAVPRMMVYPGDSEARFRRKVSGYYFWMSDLHQKLRRFVGN